MSWPCCWSPIICKDGQNIGRKKRDVNEVIGKTLKHYARNVYNNAFLHERNTKIIVGCKNIRMEITEKIWNELSDEWLQKNVGGDALHCAKQCYCATGDIGKERKQEAEEGQEIKRIQKQMN